MAVAQQTGTMATLAIIAAIGGFLATFSGHPVWGFLIGLVAIVLGIGGLLRAASPRVGGGILSIVALIVAGIGLILSVLVLVGMLVF